MKITTKTNVEFLRKQTPGIARQKVTIPKPTMKISGGPIPQQTKTILKPKIQITQNMHLSMTQNTSGSNLGDNPLKRKRDDEVELMN